MTARPDYKIAAIPIERFRRNGLDPPIAVKADTGQLLLIVIGCLGFVAVGLILITLDNRFERLAGVVSIAVCGFGALISAAYLVMVSGRDTLVLSEKGIYLGFYDLDISWRDVGPAWMFTIPLEKGQLRDVLFLIRRAPTYKSKLRWDRRLLFAFASWKAKSHGPADDADDKLSELRRAVAAEDDSVAFPIPSLIRRGLSNEEIVTIINSVVLERNETLAGGANGQAGRQ